MCFGFPCRMYSVFQDPRKWMRKAREWYTISQKEKQKKNQDIFKKIPNLCAIFQIQVNRQQNMGVFGNCLKNSPGYTGSIEYGL